MAPVKRHGYQAQFKLQAISYAVIHGNRAAAKQFNIHESMVRNWRKQENELRQVKKTKQSFRGNKARWPKLEDQLEQWISEQRTAGRGVSTITIRQKAAAIAQDMKIDNFQAGPSWCFRFMKRRHLSIRTKTSDTQHLLGDYKEKLDIFRSYCSNTITDNNIIQANHITDMHEPPLTFDFPVNHNMEIKETSTEEEKSAFTVLGCNESSSDEPASVAERVKMKRRESVMSAESLSKTDTDPVGSNASDTDSSARPVDASELAVSPVVEQAVQTTADDPTGAGPLGFSASEWQSPIGSEETQETRQLQLYELLTKQFNTINNTLQSIDLSLKKLVEKQSNDAVTQHISAIPAVIENTQIHSLIKQEVS